MADAPDASSFRDLDRELEDIRVEIAATSAGGGDITQLWLSYIALFIEAHEVTIRGPAEISRDVLIAAIVDSAASVAGPGLEAAAPNLRTFSREYIEHLSTVAQPPGGAQKPAAAGDPVTLCSGELVHEVVDIEIDGAGISFQFKRVYRNQASYEGPLGAAWDHSCDLRLTSFDADAVLLRTTGTLREQPFIRHDLFGQAGYDYWVPADGEHAIIFQDTAQSSFICRYPNGTCCRYEVDPSEPTKHRAKRIEDRHGNYLEFAYRDGLDGRLGYVRVNHPDRQVRFIYDDRQRLAAIQDYTTEFDPSGRISLFGYDDFNDLVSVTTPATADHPAGARTRYEYSSPSGNAAHNLLRIVCPDGQVALENEFGTDPGFLSFNRVVRQRQGGGESQYDYSDVVAELDDDYPENEKPTQCTRCVDLNGQESIATFNRHGHMLLHEQRLRLSGGIRSVEHRYRYNRDGAVVAELSPEGRLTQWLYGRDYYERQSNVAVDPSLDPNLDAGTRLGFGALLATVKRAAFFDVRSRGAGVGIWGDIYPDIFNTAPADSVVKLTYEPDFLQPLTSSDPRFTRSADPADPETAAYRRTLRRYEYCGTQGAAYPAPIGGSDPGSSYLYLKRTLCPDLSQADGTKLQNVVHQFTRYDANGRLLEQIDAEGSVVRYEYFDGGSGLRTGYLKSQTLDPAGLKIRTEHRVNELGVVTRVRHPKFFQPGGANFESYRTLDALGRITHTHTALPFQYETEFHYDGDGRLLEEIRQAKDETGASIGSGFDVRAFRYDQNGNLRTETISPADGRPSVVRHRYNAAGKRIRTVLPAGNEVWFGYDERLLETSATFAACTADAATTRSCYTADGLRSAVIDGRGAALRYDHDAFGRVSSTTDALGHLRIVTYDKADQISVERSYERTAAGGYVLLSRCEFLYDELNRCIAEERNLFDIPPSAADPVLDFLSPGPGSILRTQFFYDRKGRRVRTVHANGAVTRRAYDVLDRVLSETDASGVEMRFAYDAHGNLTRQDVCERVVDAASGAARERIFSKISSFDQLDRLSSSVDSAGNRHLFFYDSRNNVVKEVDALGRVRTRTYNGFNRCIGEAVAAVATGPSGTQQLQTVSTNVEYDPNGNVVAVVDQRGQRTEHVWDKLDRKILVRRPDGSAQRTIFDRASNPIEQRDPNGIVRRYAYDELNRVISLDVDDSGLLPGLLLEGARQERFAYDGGGRPVREQNDHATVRRTFDSMGRAIQEQTDIHVQAPSGAVARQFALRRSFDAAGKVIRLTYPSGRIVRYDRDSSGRILTIVQEAPGGASPGSGVFGGQYDVARYEYEGGLRKSVAFANGARADYAYDSAGRRIETAHKTAGAEFLRLSHLSDAAGNVVWRRDTTPVGATGELFRYDALNRLVGIAIEPGGVVFPAAAFAHPLGAVPAAAGNAQSQINNWIATLGAGIPTLSFFYDAAGNRLEEIAGGAPPIVYQPNRLNQYEKVAGSPLVHDIGGNRIADDQLGYAYNFKNQLAIVQDVATAAEAGRYYHDATGRRILSVVGGSTSLFVYDGQQAIEEYRGRDPWAQYVCESGLDSLRQIVTQGHERWVHSDLQGSVRALTDETGTVCAEYRYTSFGGLAAPPSAPGVYNPFLYMGRPFDLEANAYDFRLRNYAPKHGVFLQRDPTQPVHTYAFLNGNPLNAIDPLGLSASAPPGLAGALDIDLQLRLDQVAEIAGYADAEQAKLTEYYENVAHWSSQQKAPGFASRLLLDPPNLWLANSVRFAQSAEQYSSYNPLRYLGRSAAGIDAVLGVATIGAQLALWPLGWLNEKVDPDGSLSFSLMMATQSSPFPHDDGASALLRAMQAGVRGSQAQLARMWSSQNVGAAVHFSSFEGQSGIYSSKFLNGPFSAWTFSANRLPSTRLEAGIKSLVRPSRLEALVVVNDAGLTAPAVRGPFSLFQRLSGVRRTPGPGTYHIDTGVFYPGQLWDPGSQSLRLMTRSELLRGGRSHDIVLEGIGWAPIGLGLLGYGLHELNSDK